MQQTFFRGRSLCLSTCFICRADGRCCCRCFLFPALSACCLIIRSATGSCSCSDCSMTFRIIGHQIRWQTWEIQWWLCSDVTESWIQDGGWFLAEIHLLQKLLLIYKWFKHRPEQYNFNQVKFKVCLDFLKFPPKQSDWWFLFVWLISTASCNGLFHMNNQIKINTFKSWHLGFHHSEQHYQLTAYYKQHFVGKCK